MDQVYMRLEGDTAAQRSLFDAVQRVDTRLHHHFFNYIYRTLGDACKAVVTSQIGDPEAVYNNNNMQP
eukprot:m51a1_g12155 hypothetical protein (68) ;mRNA; f:116-2480